MRKVGLASLLIVLLSGCTGLWQPGAAGGGINLKAYCDKTYEGDSQGGTIVAVYRCGGNYRLVFDSPEHPDYYLNNKGEFFASCPVKVENEDCRKLLEDCRSNRFINLCR